MTDGKEALMRIRQSTLQGSMFIPEWRTGIILIGYTG